MVKAMMCLSIDAELKEMINLKYPRQASQIVNDFFRGFLDVDDSYEGASPDYITEELTTLTNQMAEIKLKQKTLKAMQEKAELEKQEKLKERYAEIERMQRSRRAAPRHNLGL